jgi:hypothetical protein
MKKNFFLKNQMMVISIAFNKRQIASIWSPAVGRPKEYVYMVLKTLYANLPNENDFYISPKSVGDGTTSTPMMLTPRHYVLIATVPFIPQLPDLFFPNREEDMVISDHIFADFRFKLAQRDRTCVLTNSWEDGIVAAHIIPHNWISKDNSNLPESVRDFLSSVEGGICSFQNGMLLDSTAHTRFDKLHWSVIWEGELPVGTGNGHWKVVAITSHGREYDGMMLRWPDGTRNDGILWRDLFPPAEAFEFHLKCAIFQHMKGGSEEFDEFDKDYDERVTDLLTSESCFSEWIYSIKRQSQKRKT